MQFIQGILFCQNYPLVHQLLLMSQEELPIDFGVGPWFERIQQIDLPIIRPTSRQKESFSISEATFFPSVQKWLEIIKKPRNFFHKIFISFCCWYNNFLHFLFEKALFSLVPPPFATYQKRPQGQRTIINMHASTTKMKSKWLWKYNIATLIQSHHKR